MGVKNCAKDSQQRQVLTFDAECRLPSRFVTKRDVVTTSELARALGLSPRSIQRYVQDELIRPEYVTPGGHYRWNVDNVLEQLRKLRERPTD